MKTVTGSNAEAQQSQAVCLPTRGAGRWMHALVPLTWLLLTLAQPPHAQTPASPAASPGSFVLTLQDGLLSLNATEAPLQGILAEIGRRMPIQVRGEMPAHVRVTLAFERLTLPEALTRLAPYVSYAYIIRRTGSRNTLVVYARRDAPLPAGPTLDASQRQDAAPGGAAARRRGPSVNALEMEIDPRQYLQKHAQ